MHIEINAPVVLLLVAPGIAKALLELLRGLLGGLKRKKR
jgi:hypothetical protein